MKNWKQYLVFAFVLAIVFAGAYTLGQYVLQADLQETPAEVHLHINSYPSLDEVLVDYGLSTCPIDPPSLCDKEQLTIPAQDPEDDGTIQL